MTPSWTLRAWPPVLWQADSTPQLRLFHLGTRVLSPGTAKEPSVGQTVWGTNATDADAGVAWDWITTMPAGIVAMADPMSVVTNLRLPGQGVHHHVEVQRGLQRRQHLALRTQQTQVGDH